jgi:hypothetical protein
MENETQHENANSKPSLLTTETIKQLELIFDFAAPEDYRDTLLEIYHNYIYHEHKDLPDHFNLIAMRMTLLLEFLREAGIQKKKQ